MTSSAHSRHCADCEHQPRGCRHDGEPIGDPKLKGRFTDMGISVLAGSPADFGKLLAAETEKWGKVIKSAGIKPE
jgi:hypothetical protein